MISHDQYLMISLFLESTQPARINRIHPLRSFNTIDNNCTCQDMPSMFFSSPSCPFPTSPFAVVVVLRQLCRQSDPQHPALEWLVRPTIWLSLGRKINIRVSSWNLSFLYTHSKFQNSNRSFAPRNSISKSTSAVTKAPRFSRSGAHLDFVRSWRKRPNTSSRSKRAQWRSTVRDQHAENLLPSKSVQCLSSLVSCNRLLLFLHVQIKDYAVKKKRNIFSASPQGRFMQGNIRSYGTWTESYWKLPGSSTENFIWPFSRACNLASASPARRLPVNSAWIVAVPGQSSEIGMQQQKVRNFQIMISMIRMISFDNESIIIDPWS